MQKQNPIKQKKSPSELTDEQGNPVKVTKHGSLGILATGYRGVLLWKEERAKTDKEQNNG